MRNKYIPYNEKLERVINYIETNLLENMSVEEIAVHNYFSIPHLYRIFRSAVGISIAEYIRMRRMSESACELIKTSNRIIDIAMKYGYESQEAFTRAFQKNFDITPALYRKRRNELILYERFSVNRINNLFTIPKEVEINIRARNSISLVGIKFNTSVQDALQNGSIINFETQEFYPRLHEIDNMIDSSMLFGVEKIDSVPERIEHFSSVEVMDFCCIPHGMSVLEIKPAKYAVFKYTGNINPNADAELKNFVFGQWILNCEYEWIEDYIIECFKFVENNDQYICNSLELYLPIKDC